MVYNRESYRRYWEQNREQLLAKQKEYRAANRDKIKERSRRYRQTTRGTTPSEMEARAVYEVRKALIVAAKSVPCLDCGGSFPPYVMDLDHVRGVKLAEVSAMVRERYRYSVPQILAEIAKCDPVCANCHRVRTHKDGGVAKSRRGPVLLRNGPTLFDAVEAS